MLSVGEPVERYEGVDITPCTDPDGFVTSDRRWDNRIGNRVHIKAYPSVEAAKAAIRAELIEYHRNELKYHEAELKRLTDRNL
jgi:hypothetical protein